MNIDPVKQRSVSQRRIYIDRDGLIKLALGRAYDNQITVSLAPREGFILYEVCDERELADIGNRIQAGRDGRM